MSIVVLNLVFGLQYNSGLTNMQRYVLTAMADTADDDGYLYPSVEYIRRKTGVCERQVREHLAHLEEKHFIMRQRRRHGSRLGTNDCWINLDLLRSIQEPVKRQVPTGGNPPVVKWRKPAASQAAETHRAITTSTRTTSRRTITPLAPRKRGDADEEAPAPRKGKLCAACGDRIPLGVRVTRPNPLSGYSGEPKYHYFCTDACAQRGVKRSGQRNLPDEYNFVD